MQLGITAFNDFASNYCNEQHDFDLNQLVPV